MQSWLFVLNYFISDTGKFLTFDICKRKKSRIQNVSTSKYFLMQLKISLKSRSTKFKTMKSTVMFVSIITPKSH